METESYIHQPPADWNYPAKPPFGSFMNRLQTESIPYEVILQEARNFVAADLETVSGLMQAVAQEAPGRLGHSLTELLKRKGKRIRSTFLLLLASTQIGLDRMRAARACAAIELIHLASLIHDDIIDDSDLRRNEKSAHQRWGNRFAVLLGDYILAKSMEMIWSDGDHRVPLALSRASSRLISAEVIEIDQAGQPDISVKQYLATIEGKTAALLEACGQCAGAVANFSDELIRHCADIGRNFGLAFQIIDDLLDFGYGAANLDKQKFSDLKNGLFTLPLLLFREMATPPEQQEMQRLLAQAGDAKAQAAISTLLMNSGAFEKARSMASEKVEACMPLLAALPQGEATLHLRRVCSLMIERTL
jgi:octaprenyl-diphosphate synthase